MSERLERGGFRSSTFGMILCVAAFSAGTRSSPATHAQSKAPVEFDVVSIKRNTAGLEAGGGIRFLPDGTLIATNSPIFSIILNASPVPTREVDGLPDWVKVERYDITAKPPAGSRPEQRSQMWQALFADRMKLAAHIEERERTTFALVRDRSDGRLGPQLKPSTLDCNPRPPGSAAVPESQNGPASTDVKNRCGMAMSGTTMVSGGITMELFVRSLAGLAGGLVNNRTGLEGAYALELRFSRPRPGGAPLETVPGDDAPEFSTALKEQLGLKLQPEKTMLPVFVIDYIERPSEN